MTKPARLLNNPDSWRCQKERPHGSIFAEMPASFRTRFGYGIPEWQGLPFESFPFKPKPQKETDSMESTSVIQQKGVGQNQTTRIWTAGLSSRFHLPGFHFGVTLFLTHSQMRHPDQLGVCENSKRSLSEKGSLKGPRAAKLVRTVAGSHA